MRHISSRRRAENEPFAPDSRPDAASFVYCVGCGKQLGQRSGLLRVRGAAINIYCSKCEGRDTNAFGEAAPITHCFRCGTKHIRYIETEPYRTIHAICPRCRPERAGRYAAGDFAPLPPKEEEAEAAASPAVEAAAAVAAVAEPIVPAAVAPAEEPQPPKRASRKKGSE
jgi:ribosomal protein S27E